ncbi:hypothetical protein Vau01_121570 [Virgisporangium aurantiacum]|uniref:WD40 repeat n=2 Tax=Virgisporangium aurantiacum TaxID=175570 RepID=A0A8J3ZN84_9ACTN|nr:hypothetical protein Vau01_121570 [Virgisporangium aurantiacum]
MAVAEQIARRAGTSFLVAALAAHGLATSDRVFDPKISTIPASVNEAVDKCLDSLPDHERTKVRGLLAALAYARGIGVDDRTWLRFAESLGYLVMSSDLDRLRDSTAADYLLQTSVNDHDGPVTRLFHQALVEDLLAWRGDRRTLDERAVFTVLTAEGWSRASHYVRTHAAEHAVGADRLGELLLEPQYLAIADIDRLMALLPIRPPAALVPPIAVLRRAAVRIRRLPPDRRMATLALTAEHLGFRELRQRFADVFPGRFRPRWAHSLGSPHQQLDGTFDIAWAVAVGRLGHRDAVVAVGRNGQMRIWDDSGQPLASLNTGEGPGLAAMAVGRLGGRDVIATAGSNATVRLWDEEGNPLGDPLHGHTDSITALAIGRLGGRDVLVSASEDRTVRIWDADGQPVGEPLHGHKRWVQTVALGRFGGQDFIASGDSGGNVQVWAADGQPFLQPITTGHERVNVLTMGRLDHTDVIVTGCNFDEQIRFWDRSGRLVGTGTGNRHGRIALALGSVDGREVLVTGDHDAVRLWDRPGRQWGASLKGHTKGAWAVAVGRLNGREVIVSGGGEGTVRIWDNFGDMAGEPMEGHDQPVTTLAVVGQGEEAVLLASDRGMAHRWSADGRPFKSDLRQALPAAVALTSGQVAGQDVIVAASYDGQLTVQDTGGRLVRLPVPTRHREFVDTVAICRDVVVSAAHRDLFIWYADGQSASVSFEGSAHFGLTAMAISHDTIVTVSGRGQMCSWNTAGQRLRVLIQQDHDLANTLAAGTIGGRDVIAFGRGSAVCLLGADGDITVAFDSPSDESIWITKLAVARLDDEDVIVAALSDGRIRVGVPATTDVHTVDLLERPRAIAVVPPNSLYVASDRALIRLDLNLPGGDPGPDRA